MSNGLVAHVIETFGRLDYAVNNSGIEGKIAPITELPEQEWDRVLDTNLKGTFLCLQHEARAMLAGGHGGAIVNVGSVNSFSVSPPGRHMLPRNTGKSGSRRALPRSWRRTESRVNNRVSGISSIRRSPSTRGRAIFGSQRHVTTKVRYRLVVHRILSAQPVRKIASNAIVFPARTRPLQSRARADT